jgi:hypothetical protein
LSSATIPFADLDIKTKSYPNNSCLITTATFETTMAVMNHSIFFISLILDSK